MTLNMEFTYNETERRKKGKLCVGGHPFYKERKMNVKIFWECEMKQKQNVVRGFIQLQVHNHTDDAANVEVEKII